MPIVNEEDYVRQEEMMAYQMPKPTVGDIVVWYRNAQRLERREQAAIVTRVGEKAIDVWLIGGSVVTGVKYFTDPRLRLNDEQREGGSWDFSKSALQLQARLGEIETKLDAIEQALRPEPTSNGFAELQSLRNMAKDLGIKGVHHMTKKMLEEAIEAQRSK